MGGIAVVLLQVCAFSYVGAVIRSPVLVLVVGTLLAGQQTALSAPPAFARLLGTVVACSGKTIITEKLVGLDLRAIVTTHVVQIGPPGVEPPIAPDTNCTYSRVPCSVVDRIDILVNGAAIIVPRSVFADLADLDRGQFTLAPHHTHHACFRRGRCRGFVYVEHHF